VLASKKITIEVDRVTKSGFSCRFFFDSDQSSMKAKASEKTSGSTKDQPLANDPGFDSFSFTSSSSDHGSASSSDKSSRYDGSIEEPKQATFSTMQQHTHTRISNIDFSSGVLA